MRIARTSSQCKDYVSEFQRFYEYVESSAAGSSNRKSYHNKMAVLWGALLNAFLANGIAELLCCASEMSSRRDLRSHPLCLRETALKIAHRELCTAVAHVAFVTNGNIRSRILWSAIKVSTERLSYLRQISFTWQSFLIYLSRNISKRFANFFDYTANARVHICNIINISLHINC